jgi:hypothetical protein
MIISQSWADASTNSTRNRIEIARNGTITETPDVQNFRHFIPIIFKAEKLSDEDLKISGKTIFPKIPIIIEVFSSSNERILNDTIIPSVDGSFVFHIQSLNTEYVDVKLFHKGINNSISTTSSSATNIGIMTDKPHYYVGESVFIFGAVPSIMSTHAINSVILYFTNPNFETFVDQVALDQNGRYTYQINELQINGTYGITANYLGKNTTTTFDVLSQITSVADSETLDAETSIPSWIKNNSRWWADGAIGDNDFVQGIQFLINQKIIMVPATTPDSGTENNVIPSWIKQNAGWWADGAITDNDFVQGIQFLIKNGMIRV